MALPTSRLIGSTLSDPGSIPISSSNWAMNSMTSGSLEGGLSTIGLPDAMAGATLWSARFSGKLKGEIPAIGPIGNRRTTAESSLRGRQEIEGNDISANALCFF